MKRLDFVPAKSKEEFRKNYNLHDKAVDDGLNLLTQWGIEFKPFGEDRRYERVWEKGEDKPDVIIYSKEGKAFLDWKAKKSNRFLVNERAVEAYARWSEKYKLPVLIAFFLYDAENVLIDRRLVLLGKDAFFKSEKREWDKNRTVEFDKGIELFNKVNLIKAISNWYKPDDEQK